MLLDARRLLNREDNDDLVHGTILEGSVSTTTPQLSERLFVLHLASLDRILRSVPSPGVGH